jgi:hypothetical protein
VLTLPKPTAPVNPAERPIANAVLEAALLPLHDVANFNHIFITLATKYPNLEEELHERLEQEQEARLADACKVVELYA